MGSVDLGWVVVGALVLSLGALGAAVALLVANVRRERADVEERLDHVLGALSVLGGAVEQARAEAAAARTAVQGMRSVLGEVHQETCGPVSLRPGSLRPSTPPGGRQPR